MTDNLTHYLQLWHLRDPEPLAQSERGHVYAVYQNGEKLILKLFTPIGAEDESDGVIALRHFDGYGAVRLLAQDDKALLLEYAGDEELAQLVYRGDDFGAAQVIAAVLNKLHGHQPLPTDPPLRNLRQRFRSLFNRAERDQAVGEDSIYVRGARVIERLLEHPQDECILHGDIQHHNIRHHPVRGWLAYDPKGLYGERLYDAGNTVCNPSNVREQVMSETRMLKVTQLLADGMGAKVGRLRAFVFAYACLSASWFGDTEHDEKHQILAVAHNTEQYVDF